PMEEPPAPSTKSRSTSASRYRDDAQIRHLTTELQRALGAKVKIKDVKGRGRIEIHYDDHDVLQSILERFLDD
ncbi:MAG: hypothetical protein ACNA8W_09515, partial [Bradymonadaceae bacterium]